MSMYGTIPFSFSYQFSGTIQIWNFGFSVFSWPYEGILFLKMYLLSFFLLIEILHA